MNIDRLRRWFRRLSSKTRSLELFNRPHRPFVWIFWISLVVGVVIVGLSIVDSVDSKDRTPWIVASMAIVFSWLIAEKQTENRKKHEAKIEKLLKGILKGILSQQGGEGRLGQNVHHTAVSDSNDQRDCRQDPVHRKRTRNARPMDWVSRSLLAVSGVLFTLTVILSYFDQPIGAILLGIVLTYATFMCFFWYSDTGRRGSWKFFSLVAASVILFVLSGFFVSQNNQAMGFTFVGLFGVVFSYSMWLIISPDSDWIGLAREIFKTLVILLTLLAIALAIEGLGMLTGLNGISAIARELSEMLGGS